MAEIRNYKDLDVWKKSGKLVSKIYIVTRSFPKEELYALTSQLRRAAISIPSNIAEGHERRGTKKFLQFISIAIGSLAEVDAIAHFRRSAIYKYRKQRNSNARHRSLQKMLHALRNALKAKL